MRRTNITKRQAADTARQANKAIENDPATPAKRKPKGKIGMLVAMLRRPEGATIDAMMAATGWQAHSVRGAMSASVKKALGLDVVSQKTDAGRVYRIAGGPVA